MELLKGNSLGYAMALPANIRLGRKGLPGKKHSSLLRKLVNYGRKKFYNIGPRLKIFPTGHRDLELTHVLDGPHVGQVEGTPAQRFLGLGDLEIKTSHYNQHPTLLMMPPIRS